MLAPLGRRVGVRVTTVYGGAPMGRQIEQLARGVDIVVATPGRLIDLIERRAASLGQVEIAVLDEADHMADLGFMPAVTQLLDATPPGGQRLLFSATLDRDVDRLVTRYLSDPALHAVAPVTEPGVAADHQVFVLPAEDKVAIAAEIAARPDRTLFFVRTKHGARLAKQLTRAGVEAGAIHGDLNQNQRQRALDGFAPVIRGCWSPPTWPPAASMSTTSAWWCTSTRRTTTRTTCTGRAAPAAPVRPGPCSRSSTPARSARSRGCTRRPASARPATGYSPVTPRSGTSRRPGHRSRRRPHAQSGRPGPAGQPGRGRPGRSGRNRPGRDGRQRAGTEPCGQPGLPRPQVADPSARGQLDRSPGAGRGCPRTAFLADHGAVVRRSQYMARTR